MPTVAERRESIQAYLRDSAETKRRAAEACTDSIVAAADLIVEAFRTGAKLLLCGNGGSAADCQHMATEFVSRFTKDFERPGLPAIALTTDSSFLTAYANDCGFDGIFERQVEALGRPGDVLIGISTSGNSPNVIRAVRRARAEGLRSVVLAWIPGPARQLGGRGHFGAERGHPAHSGVTPGDRTPHLLAGRARAVSFSTGPQAIASREHGL